MKDAYTPHKITRLRPLHDNIIVREMNFEHRVTVSGIILPSDDGKNTGIRPRWAEVYAVGPAQTQITTGQWVLVEHGRWTRGITVQDDTGTFTVRKIDPAAIMMVSDEPVHDEFVGELGI